MLVLVVQVLLVLVLEVAVLLYTDLESLLDMKVDRQQPVLVI